MRGLPFEIDRKLSSSLTDQVVTGIRAAIESGAYADGGTLPSIRDLAAGLGVSEIVIRSGYARLTEMGLVASRRGRGFVAVGRKSHVWRGHVLVIGYGAGENYLSYSIVEVLRRRFTRERHLVSCVNVDLGADDGNENGELAYALMQRYDLVVSLCDSPRVLRALVRAGCPTVALYNEHRPKGRNVVPVKFLDGAALPGFVAYCRSSGVRRILQIAANCDFADARKAFAGTGIDIGLMYLRRDFGYEDIEQLAERTGRLFAAKLSKGRAWLPDLLYFTDDYMATAAVLTLLKHGVRIPEDVRIVSWANRGLGPVLPVPFGRVQFDGRSAGERIFEIAKTVLRGGNPEACDIRTTFIEERK